MDAFQYEREAVSTVWSCDTENRRLQQDGLHKVRLVLLLDLRQANCRVSEITLALVPESSE